MKQTILYNFHTYTAISDTQIAVIRGEKEHLVCIDTPLKENDLMQIVPLLDELLAKNIVSIETK